MKLLSDFHTAILKNDGSDIFSALTPHPRLSPAQQFAIYSSGYRIRLIAAIKSDYPALLQVIGGEEFDKLALQYIEQTPPTSYNLDIYPHDFAKFVRTQCDDIFVKELATLEAVIAKVFMLPDSKPLPADKLIGLTPEDFAEIKLQLRTACQLLQLATNANDWLTHWKTTDNTNYELLTTDYYLLIYRHNNEVKRLELSAPAFALLSKLNDGFSVGEALDMVINETPYFMPEIASNLQIWFAEWVQNGVFTD